MNWLRRKTCEEREEIFYAWERIEIAGLGGQGVSFVNDPYVLIGGMKFFPVMVTPNEVILSKYSHPDEEVRAIVTFEKKVKKRRWIKESKV